MANLYCNVLLDVHQAMLATTMWLDDIIKHDRNQFRIIQYLLILRIAQQLNLGDFFSAFVYIFPQYIYISYL